MRHTTLSVGEEEQIGELYKQGLSYRKIAEKLGLNSTTVHNFVVRKLGGTLVASEKELAVRAVLASGGRYEDAAAEAGVTRHTVNAIQRVHIFDDLPLTEPRLHQERLNFFRGWRDGLYVVCADQHHPIQHKPTIDAMIKECKRLKPDGAIVAGDCLDMRSLSFFRRGKPSGMADEISASKEFYERLIDYCGRVIYIAGANHELRLIKRLLEWFGKAPGMGKGDYIIWKALQDARDWYIEQGVVKGVTVTNSSWVQIGDCTMSHFDRATKRAGTTAGGVAEHFLERRPHGLPQPRYVLQAHLHRYSMSTWYGIRCITLPGQTMHDDYSVDGKAGGAMDLGFMVIRIKDGKLVWNESKVYLYEVTGDYAY